MQMCCPPIQAKDPRFKVHDSSLYLERVTQIDEGRYTLYINEGLPQDALTLKVRGETIIQYSIFKRLHVLRNH